jgi:UDP-N-acetyl-D-galactosamine dehydrogenase
MKKIKNFNIAIIGVGYVGLPLALTASKYFKVIAFDLDQKRIKDLKLHCDKNFQYTKNQIKKSKNLIFTDKITDIQNCNVYIITLPTPLTTGGLPDLESVKKISKDLANFLKKNDLVIYESTVYPGATEEVFIPILEKNSLLKCNKDFFVGYSPERINPGDKKNTFVNIKKITAGSNNLAKKKVSYIYKKIIKAGIYEVNNIKTAELSKVLENTQRFVNIALINEISVLCEKLNINTQDLINAASTKWNFQKFSPGLVGGHCIAVDPLYLSYKSKKFELNPDMISAAHKVNKNMGAFIIKSIFKRIKKNKKNFLILGLTFKEDCPDFRNTGVKYLIGELNKKNITPDVFDPFINESNIKDVLLEHDKIKFKVLNKLKNYKYDVIIIAVAHKYFKNIGIKRIRGFLSDKNNIIFDVKNLFKKDSNNYISL